jgi:hypothetical protein
MPPKDHTLTKKYFREEDVFRFIRGAADRDGIWNGDASTVALRSDGSATSLPMIYRPERQRPRETRSLTGLLAWSSGASLSCSFVRQTPNLRRRCIMSVRLFPCGVDYVRDLLAAQASPFP